MAQTLVDQGLGLMVAAVIFIGVAIPVSGQVLVTDLEGVQAEEFQPDALPSNYTVNNFGDGLVEDSETVQFYNGTADSYTTLEEGTDYNVIDYETGEFELLDSATVDGYDSTSDRFEFDYEYKPEGYVGGTAGQILKYVVLALAMAMFVAALSVVR